MLVRFSWFACAPQTPCTCWDFKVEQAGMKSHSILDHLNPWRERYSEQMDRTLQKEWVVKSACPCTGARECSYWCQHVCWCLCVWVWVCLCVCVCVFVWVIFFHVGATAGSWLLPKFVCVWCVSVSEWVSWASEWVYIVRVLLCLSLLGTRWWACPSTRLFLTSSL